MLYYFQHLNFTYIAVLSALFGSVAIVLARVLLKELRSRDMLAINFLIMAAILLLLSPGFYYFKYSPMAVLLVLVIAIIDAFANYFYFKTFEKSEASLAAPALSLAPVFTFMFGWLVLSEKVDWLSIVISLIIIVGVMFFSFNFKDWHKVGKETILPALLSSFLFGISALPAKYLLSTLHITNAPTLYMIRAALIALLSLLFFRFSIRDINLKQFRWLFVRSIFVIAQWLLLYFALTIGNTGVTVTLANITPIFVFILGIIFLREKFTYKKALAAMLILILSFII